MKVRDSGMPEIDLWESLLDVDLVLDRMRVGEAAGDLVEFGCGYGTFTIPTARLVAGTVHALDVEEEMVESTRARAREAGASNVFCLRRDFVADGTGLPGGSVAYAMLFNILHHERPVEILGEAHRILAPGGIAGIVHWRYDPATPRGPALAIRPRPEDLVRRAEEAGFAADRPFDLPPWHYGILARKAPRPDGGSMRGFDGEDI